MEPGTPMTTEIFTRDLIQAVSDWQRGGSHDQKVKRGERLKTAAALLPKHFRTCAATCFRQEAHEKDRIWQLLADNHLPETITSWTTDIAIAKAFKGGPRRVCKASYLRSRLRRTAWFSI
jgi:hypothetical protein